MLPPAATGKCRFVAIPIAGSWQGNTAKAIASVMRGFRAEQDDDRFGVRAPVELKAGRGVAWTRAVALGEEVGDGGDPAGDRGVGQVAEADHQLRRSGDVIGAVAAHRIQAD